MGQGRSTTGMVISSLLCQVVALGKDAPSPECIPQAPAKVRLPAVVASLVSKLPDGDVVVRWVDSVIDGCAHMMNLRTVIAEKKRMMDRSWNNWTEWSKARDKYVSFTERYLYVLLFGQYIWSE